MSATALDELLARQALHDLVVTYARAVDRRDAALLASVFFDDADVVTGVIDGKGPDYARDVVAMIREHLAVCFHSISNEYFEVNGDRATGEVYVLAYTTTRGDAPQETFTGGRYRDRYERRDGNWKIAARTFDCDWTSTRPLAANA